MFNRPDFKKNLVLFGKFTHLAEIDAKDAGIFSPKGQLCRDLLQNTVTLFHISSGSEAVTLVTGGHVHARLYEALIFTYI